VALAASSVEPAFKAAAWAAAAIWAAVGPLGFLAAATDRASCEPEPDEASPDDDPLFPPFDPSVEPDPRPRRAFLLRGFALDESLLDFSTGSAWTMRPRPLQCTHGAENTSISPEPTRFRVIWTNPNEVTSAT